MTRLRRLNDRGIAAFRQYLQQIREGEEFQPSPAVLHIDDYSSRVEPAITIEDRQFETKLDAAVYLTEALAPLGTSASGDRGLWSWLALYYFEQLSPKNAKGARRPREDYHYIPSSERIWSRDRHLLAGPWRLYALHGIHARLLLNPRVHEHGAFVYDLGFRRELITNRGLLEAIDTLYWDREEDRPKKGASSTKNPGNLRRLITVVQQLDFNYDLYGMNAREILDLLPREFDRWKG
jgi:hypothetical protein